MKNNFIRRIIALTVVSATLLTVVPIGASASWKQDSTGWWNTEGNSWSIGWRQIDKKWYYFNSSGYMEHDKIVEGYQLGSDGAWIINNPIASTNTTSTTLENVNKRVGWQEINGKKYFNDANGTRIVNNWLNVGGKWYYLDGNGVMLSNSWINIKGNNYYLQTDGSKAVNTTINGYKVDNDGVWIDEDISNPNTSNDLNTSGDIVTKADEDTYSNEKTNDTKEKYTKSVKTASELERYLNTNYSSLKTPIGTLKFEFDIDENDDDMFPYDFWIQTDDTDIEDSKYDIDYFSAYDLEHSTKIKDKDKEKTIELLKDYQKKVAEVSMKYFPDKKIKGGFYSGFYKYASIRVGYESIQFLSWTNYNPDADNYDDSEVDGFNWNTKYDDYDFGE